MKLKPVWNRLKREGIVVGFDHVGKRREGIVVDFDHVGKRGVRQLIAYYPLLSTFTIDGIDDSVLNLLGSGLRL